MFHRENIEKTLEIAAQEVPMIIKLFQMAWSLPFLVLLACVPLYYSFNFNQEYNQIRIFSQQYFDRSNRALDGRREFRICLLNHLPATLGRGNLFFMAACLTLGGVGSLLWMAIASTFCILLRFLRVTALFHTMADEASLTPDRDLGLISHRKRNLFPDKGLHSFFRRTVGGELHFRCGALLGWIWSGIGLLIGIMSFSNYVTVRAIWGGRQGFSLVASAVALLFIGVSASLSVRKKGISIRGNRVLLWSYLLLLLFLLLKNWKLLFMAAAAIVTDGFQLHWFVGPMLGKGWGMALACGVCLCCWNSGLFHESGDRRFAACAWKAEVGAAEAGFWAMLDGLAGIVVAGGLGGILVVICGISQPESGIGLVENLIRNLSEGSGTLILLFSLLSLWLGWCACREEFDILTASIHDLFQTEITGQLLPRILYPLAGLAITLFAALWDKVAPNQFHWLILLFLLLFLVVLLQVIMAMAVSEQTATELERYQKRHWKKGLG